MGTYCKDTSGSWEASKPQGSINTEGRLACGSEGQDSSPQAAVGSWRSLCSAVGRDSEILLLGSPLLCLCLHWPGCTPSDGFLPICGFCLLVAFLLLSLCLSASNHTTSYLSSQIQASGENEVELFPLWPTPVAVFVPGHFLRH